MRKLKRKVKSPRTPWDAVQIQNERRILNEYGLRRKSELRKSEAILRNFRRRARQLIAMKDEREESVLLGKTKRLGIVKGEGATLDTILSLSVRDILDRRLQTIVSRKGASEGMKHARQMITHGHVFVGEKRTKHPSYIVSIDEEGRISFAGPGAKTG